MKPTLLHRICAYPVLIAWAIGACVLNTVCVVLLSKAVSLWALVSDWKTLFQLGMGFIPTTLLGYFLGMFTCWPFVRPLCSKFNGAPLKVGDQVLILSGRLQRHVARVSKIAVSQGGWNLAVLEIKPPLRDKCSDIFEEYSLLKLGPE